MGRLGSLLSADSAPYLVTLAIAGIAWAITHTVDRIVTSPIVEYDIVYETGDGVTKVVVRLENLSTGTGFRNVTFVLREAARDADIAFDCKECRSLVIGTAPVSTTGYAADSTTQSVTFRVPSLPPGGRVDLVAHYTGQARPIFLVKEDGSDIRLLEPSLETWFARHESNVILAIIAFWLALLAVTVVVAGRAGHTGDTSSRGAHGC